MAITNAQQYKQMQLVKPRADGKRPGYYGSDAGFGDDDYKDASAAFDAGSGSGENNSQGTTFQDVRDNNKTIQAGIDNAAKYRADAENRKKAKEKADKERRASERKEARKDQKKLTSKQKKTRRMQLAAFKRFQELEKYVDPYGDETTFADMSGEEAANLTGYKGNLETGFEYDKDRFRDSKTGKIKNEFTEMVNINEGKKNIFGQDKKPKFVEQFKPDAIPGYDFSINPVRNNFDGGLGTLTSNPGGVRPNDYPLGSPAYGTLGVVKNVIRPETGLQAFNTLEEARNIQDFAGRFQDGDDSAYKEFEDYITRNKVSIDDEGGQQDPCKGPNPPAYCFIGQNADETQEDVITRNLAGLTPRIGGSIFDFTGMADGGLADMNREAFLLGGIAKGFKKAIRGVKKIAKSKIGKAALIGALGYGLGGGTFFGKMLPGVTRGGQGFGGFGGLSSIFGNVGDIIGGTGLGDKFAKFAGNKVGMGILGASILPLLAGKTEEEKDDILKEYYASQQLTPSTTKRQMGSEFDFYNYNLAEGGMPSKEPVAKKVMPLLDMDGMEKDYRADGGFVPLGRMEKADDVPARLSKNEFVFTADAVRNAGEGDVDKGAEVMYNMMKNLESGGEVSEESQGLDGAREMFQTSQRLGEVI